MVIFLSSGTKNWDTDRERAKEGNIQAGAEISTIRKLFSTLVSPILLYNSEIWGAFLKKKQLKSFESFVDKMFGGDSSKHESLQMKMGKIALGVLVTQYGSKRITWYVPFYH